MSRNRIDDPCRTLGALSPPHRAQVAACALTEHVFSPAPSSLADAEDARKATCLMLAWPGDRSPLGLCPVAAGLAGRGGATVGSIRMKSRFPTLGLLYRPPTRNLPGPDAAAFEGVEA